MTVEANDEDTRLAPDDAFSLLGNDIRIDILQALWDAFESGPRDNELSYSELFEQIDYHDTGNFTYHLEKLTGPFIRQTDQGYELKQTGINVVRAVVSGAVLDDPEFDPTTVDFACPICEAPVEITYSDEFMKFLCTECEGGRRWKDESGLLFGALTPPVGVEQRTIEEASRSAVAYSLHEIFAFHNGICPHCSSPPETTLNVCHDHDPGEGTLCQSCNRYHLAVARMVCTTCKRSVPPPVRLIVLANPDVTAFYHQHDIKHRFATWETVVRSFGVGEKLISEDPLNMRFTVPAGGDRLQLTINRDLQITNTSLKR